MKYVLLVLFLCLAVPMSTEARTYGELTVDELVSAANRGDAVAQVVLGWRYYDGEGVAKDFTQAVFWWRKAAEQGEAVAQRKLGLCYYKGEGVEKDFTQAVFWWRKAAEQGNAAVQNNLGWCYYKGEGVAKDFKQAVFWFRKAAEQGDAHAQDSLAWCYFSGKGVAQDYHQAVSWFRKAAEQGNAVAQANLGLCYSYGYGVEKNPHEAMALYTKAAEKGQASALTELAYNAYANNDMQKARSYWNKLLKLDKKTDDDQPEEVKKHLTELKIFLNPKSRILYLANDMNIDKDGVIEQIGTDVPFIIDTAENVIVYPESYAQSLVYTKENFQENVDYSSLDAKGDPTKPLNITLKTSFVPKAILFGNSPIPELSYTRNTVIEKSGENFHYVIAFPYKMQRKQLQNGLKVTVKTASGKEYTYVIKGTKDNVTVEEKKAVSF